MTPPNIGGNPDAPPQEAKTSNLRNNWLEQLKAAGSDPHDPDASNIRQAIREIERLNAQWEKAARLLNEFRPVTGIDEWVAVRVGALNYVLMAASPTPAVGPLVPTPESRDG